MTTPPLTRTPITPDLLRGVLAPEPGEVGLLPHRLPAWARAQARDPQLDLVQSQPSGGRLVFRTAASVVELETLPTKRLYPGLPPRPDGVHELVVDGEVVASGTVPGGRTLVVDLAGGAPELRPGEPGRVRFAGLPGRPVDVEVWLPHDEATELVALHTDAPVEPASAVERPVWLHHGSSISHGSNAERPTGTWPAVAARQAGVELVNLGLGGSALLDPFVARVMRDVPADVLSVKLGINLVNADLMRRRALGPAVHGFLDTIRDGHPDTPLVVVSALACPIHEDTPGPAAMDLDAFATGRVAFRATGDPAEVAAGRLTLRVVRDELARVVAERQTADPALAYLDGLELFGPDDVVRLPLPDELHLDAEAHQLVGRRFAERVLSRPWRG
ncbi:SGNH/GDSL hydrolase family protein [Nocardioides marinquilinus]|uniref:SGNH/GDSL hydrolase family protein n=1 Tax=Nocardioides marinquilinus TaxID=1210400 RepID=A0ABP9PLU5_9ACTN